MKIIQKKILFRLKILNGILKEYNYFYLFLLFLMKNI